MGKLIVVCAMTVDGFYEGPGKDVTALPLDPAFYKYNLERITTARTVLLGGKSYADFRDFWPQRADDPEAPDYDRNFAKLYNTRDKVAVSDHASLPGDGHPWARNTRIVPQKRADEVISKLKSDDGEIVMWGSRTLWTDLLAKGFVDELHLFVAPALLGDGTRVFKEQPKSLKRIGSRDFEGSDSILLIYEVIKADA